MTTAAMAAKHSSWGRRLVVVFRAVVGLPHQLSPAVWFDVSPPNFSFEPALEPTTRFC